MTATIDSPPLASEAGDPSRLVPISVNLLPAEVLAARAGRASRRFAIALMAVVAVAVGVWYYHAHNGAVDAAAQLKAQNNDLALQTHQADKYTALTTTKADIATQRTQVNGAMKGSIAWNVVVSHVRGALPDHVGLTGITANATAVTAAPAPAAPSTTDGSATGATAATPEPTPGTLILTGTAATKQQVSAYSNQLASVKELTDPIVTGVQRQDKGAGVTFSLQVNLTKKALSTRYDSKAGR